jgi:hypothetical protein
VSGSIVRSTTAFEAREPSFSGVPRIVRELTSALHAAHLSYCHWKGNARLQEAVAGRRDLDILVDREGALALSAILAIVGFKRFASSPWIAVPALEDYLALDSDTGRLVHLHLHYRLTVGDSVLKGYRLPWEALVLSTRRFDTTMAMYVADPHMELLLLIAGKAVKLGPIDRIAGWLGRPCVDALARSDLRWLAARTDPHRLAELSEGLLGPEATRLLLDMVMTEPSDRLLRALKRRATPPLSVYRTYTPAGAVVRRGMRFLVGLAVALNRRILRSLVIAGRTLPSGGLMIAFEGGDETERATLVDRIAAWLTWKLDVLVLDGGGGGGRRRGFAGAVTALVRARNSRARRRKAFRARSRGMIVLSDGVPEGRSRDAGSPPERAWDADPPNLVIRLRRAPSPGPDDQTVPPPEGRPTLHSIDIDPDQSPEHVLLVVQRALWQKV